MMDRCETCRHWTQHEVYLEGDCAALHATSTAKSVGRLRAVLYPASETKSARVMTLPDFGCVLHVPQEAQ